jgi:hypothetical protein
MTQVPSALAITSIRRPARDFAKEEEGEVSASHRVCRNRSESLETYVGVSDSVSDRRAQHSSRQTTFASLPINLSSRSRKRKTRQAPRVGADAAAPPRTGQERSGYLFSPDGRARPG